MRQYEPKKVKREQSDKEGLGTPELIVNDLLRGFQSVKINVVVVLNHHLGKLEVVETVFERVQLTPNNLMLFNRRIHVFVDKLLQLPKFFTQLNILEIKTLMLDFILLFVFELLALGHVDEAFNNLCLLILRIPKRVHLEIRLLLVPNRWRPIIKNAHHEIAQSISL